MTSPGLPAEVFFKRADYGGGIAWGAWVRRGRAVDLTTDLLTTKMLKEYHRPMRPSTGRWASGSDCFTRDAELRVLEAWVRDGNHTLLTGRRRMGRISVAHELGRRLAQDGWTFLFANVEDAACPDDVLAEAFTQDVFTPAAQRCFAQLYAETSDDARECVTNARDVPIHDGYLAEGAQGHAFPSRLPKDWRAARFRDHHMPLQSPVSADT